MKKMLFMMFLLYGIAACLNAADLREFYIYMPAGVTTAGSEIPVTITAIDINGFEKTDYSGSVSITASVGDVKFMETGTDMSSPFVSGRFSGIIKPLGAASSLTLTVKALDAYGATGTAIKQVNPGAYFTRLILTKGQEYAPGTALGYTGMPETLVTMEEFYVTVTACDEHFNRISSPFPSNVYLSNSKAGITPTSVDMAVTDIPGTAVYSVTVFSSSPGIYTLTSTDSSSTDKTVSVDRSFVSNNTYYMWPEINGITFTAMEIPVIAGVPLEVTLKASNFPREDGKGILTDFNIDAFVSAVKYDSVFSVMEAFSNTVFVRSGEGTVNVGYFKTDRIRIKIMPEELYYDNNGTYYPVTKSPSDVVQVYAAAPQSFSFTSDKVQIQPGETANLNVTVFDAYMNPVSRTAVEFSIPADTGVLSVTNTATQDYDYAINIIGGSCSSVYTAPVLAPSSVTITATVAGLAPKTIVLEFISATSTADKKTVKNTPNPFNPDKGGTKIGYYLEADSKVTFKLYNMFGGLVWSKQVQKGEELGLKGPRELLYEGRTDGGFKIGVGLYVLKIYVENDSEKYVLERKIAVKK